jgi:large subunit ribosomal protein L6
MSRVAKAPIEIPTGVEVSINDSIMAVKGKLGQMEMEIHPSVVIANTENVLTFDVIKVNKKEEKKAWALSTNLSSHLTDFLLIHAFDNNLSL